MRVRPIHAGLCLLLALLLVPVGATGTPEASAADDCPPVRPVEDVAPGDVGTGLTVSRGTEPEPFDVEVVDVLQDAIAPGLPLIVVEVASPEIDRVGGIWAGISGSPVYIDDQLVGAVAYGFSLGPSKLAGVTPADAMLDVRNRPAPTPAPGTAAGEVSMSSEVRAHAAAEEGLSAQQSSSMAPLPVPVRISGAHGARIEPFADAFERAYPGTTVVRGVGGSATTIAASAPIVPGGNLAVSLAYGDFTAVGVGTVTAVCDGDVIGFGHPMTFAGATRLGLHGASAVRVADDSTVGPYKLANAGPVVGTIEQDRLAAVVGPLDRLPVTTAITSTITNLDDGRTVEGRTDSVQPESLSWAALMHGWINYDARVLDTWSFSGTAEVDWTIRGVKADGTAWEVSRGNRHADRYDLSSAALFEMVLTVAALQDNPFTDVHVSEIEYEATAGSPYRSYRILEDRIAVRDGETTVDAREGIVVYPGQSIELVVPLRLYRGGVEEVELTLDVPDDVLGAGHLVITGGGDGGDDECLWWPEDCIEHGDGDGFQDLLEDIADRPRADELTARLFVFDDWGWGEWEGDDGDLQDARAANGGGWETAVAEARVRLDSVVNGWAELPVYVWDTDDCPVPSDLHFWDVDLDSPHASAVACAFALGLTSGVSEDPPLFAPERAVQRDQAASFIAGVLERGPKELPEGEDRFGDLGGNVHRDAIEQLAAAGIVQGRSASVFDPRTPVTREQMATLLTAAARWATDEPLLAVDGPHFPDVAGVHADNVDAAFELGLLQGRADGTFGPTLQTRRDQMATLVVRLYRWLDAQ